MDDVKDIRVGVAELGEKPRQATGLVGDPAAERQITPLRCHAVTDDPHQQQRIDVATREHDDDRSLEVVRCVHQGRHRGGACRLHDDLGPLDEGQQRG